jgi:hypothetical protein
MDGKPGPADVDRFLEHCGAPALFSQLGEGDRRRVVLDPSSEIFKAGGCRHA